MTWHGGCKDFTSRRLGRAWRARFRQGRPREGMTWLDEQGRMPMQNAGLVGLSRQVALAREMDVVANNIANLNTTGYKADGSLFEEYLSTGARADQTGSRVGLGRDRGVWHDMSQGPIERTGNSLDVAVDGNAFLVVQTPRGERYTRNGSMQINPTGQLVTSDGNPVLGDGGPISLQPTDRQVSISSDGTISVREGNSKVDSARGKLRLVTFAIRSSCRKTAAALSMRRPACSRNPRRRPASCKAPSRNRTCAAWSRCRA